MPNLRHKIAQMLIVGFSGSTLDATSPLYQWIKQDPIGGVILFDKDLKRPNATKNLLHSEQIKQLTQQIYTHALSSHGLIPFISLDYEGGHVDRLQRIAGMRPTLSAAKLAQCPIEESHQHITNMAMTLSSFGFNLNFAPVLDLSLNHNTGIIGRLERSFSAEPQKVIDSAKQFVSIFNQFGIMCCYKHFPGHGSAQGDTHLNAVDVSETFIQEELLPYVELSKESSLQAMIMTAHVINRQLDSSDLPATLSYKILTELLRTRLGFKGIIISDDLQMEAITETYSLQDSLRLTLLAGADMVIFANQLDEVTPKILIEIIESLVLQGEIPQERIDASYQRIVNIKSSLVQTTFKNRPFAMSI